MRTTRFYLSANNPSIHLPSPCTGKARGRLQALPEMVSCPQHRNAYEWAVILRALLARAWKIGGPREACDNADADEYTREHINRWCCECNVLIGNGGSGTGAYVQCVFCQRHMHPRCACGCLRCDATCCSLCWGDHSCVRRRMLFIHYIFGGTSSP